MKALVVGYGSIGRRHIANLTNYLGIKTIVVTKRIPDSFSRKNDCYLVKTLEEGIREEPDFAVIANETSLHVRTAMTLAQSKIDIFVEKPLSHNFKDVDKLLRTVKKKQIITLIGCNLRFHPCFLKMKDMITKNKLGRIISVKAENSSYLPNWHPDEDYSKSYVAQKKLGGGIVHTCIHEIDYLYWLLGKIKGVYSITGKYSDLKIKTDDLSAVIFKFRNNIVGELHLDYYHMPNFRNCKIVGTNGSLFLDYTKNELDHYDIKSKKWTKVIKLKNYDENTMYVDELRHFHDCVSKNKNTVNPICEGFEVLKIAEAILKSSRTKKMVNLR